MITYKLLPGYFYPLVDGDYISVARESIGLMIGGLIYLPIDLLDIYEDMSTIQNWIIPDQILESEFYHCDNIHRSTDNNRPFHWG